MYSGIYWKMVQPSFKPLISIDPYSKLKPLPLRNKKKAIKHNPALFLTLLPLEGIQLVSHEIH